MAEDGLIGLEMLCLTGKLQGVQRIGVLASIEYIIASEKSGNG
jgi:hypothetical protein